MLNSTKRRKISKRFLTLSHRNNMKATWPAGVVPSEIFSLIISFLSRSNVQNMRLVNREFEEKVAHDLFQTVVVPFSPEIYGIAEDSIIGSGHLNEDGQHTALLNAAVMLQDKGMRVFQGFGRHIFRFGMSFEFDYNLLTTPPVKSDQEAITTFWGIYRWPFKRYNRYHQLEGLEQAADETRTMAKALRFISNSKELGLSIDGGLGWLAGPDFNPNHQSVTEKAIVFGESRFRPEEKPSPPPSQRLMPTHHLNPLQLQSFVVHSADEPSDDTGLSAFVQMLREAGYEGFGLAQSVRTLIESEGLFQSSHATPSSPLAPTVRENLGTENSSDSGGIESFIRASGQQGVRLDRIRTAVAHALLVGSNPAQPETTNHYPLKPNDLTTAQKEMLLETEWAQRAFMQSYAIAVIDNPATFQGIETLSISRIPSRHLAILRRGDFWTSLSQLRKVSLAVIPDWREVVKLPTSWVEDVRVPPSQAIGRVYQLLNDHIAPRKSITTLRFEWLCGGEEAAGIFARNQLILAAPLTPQATDMVDGTILSVPLLNLPYVEHLALKNCWISPHIMAHFVRTVKEKSLMTLTLQSVSLSAPAPRSRQTVLNYVQHLQQNATAQVHTNTQGQATAHTPHIHVNPTTGAQALATAFHIQQPPLVNPHVGTVHQGLGQTFSNNSNQPVDDPACWLKRPRFGSWAHVIDQISPGETLSSLLFARDLGPEPPTPGPTKLKRVTFNSCGYVRLLLDFDQSMLDPPNPAPADTHAVAKRRSDIEQYMMKPLEHTLGTVINYINEEETKTLETAWNLRIGWEKQQKSLMSQALADGIRAAGQGRFSGVLEAAA